MSPSPRSPRVVPSALALLLAACAPSTAGVTDGGAPAPDLACAPRARYAATGFFRLETDCGAARLVDPDGAPFYSFGVNHVSWNGDPSPKTMRNPYAEAVRARYGDEASWADATARRLSDWGWNTVGSWSSESVERRLPYTHMLSLSGGDWLSGRIPDWFAPSWEADVQARAKAGVTSRRDDRLLVGYFIDNEMHWGPDWRSGRDLFEELLALDARAPGKQALVALLRERHGGDLARFNAAWRVSLPDWDALAAITKLGPRGTSEAADADRSAAIHAVARRFFAVTTGAIRAVDPNHLVLGVRFVAGLVPVEVAQEAGAFLDVVSVNAYEFVVNVQGVFRPDVFGFVDIGEGGFLEALYRATGRPLLVTEFSFRAADAGLPNSWPPQYPTLPTQAARADRFEAYARRCLGSPWITGYHWFEWADEPAEGRFDGEDNNFGLVTAGDDPYPVMVARTKAVNRAPWAR